MANTRSWRFLIFSLAVLLLIPGSAQAEKRKRKLFEVSVIGSYLTSTGAPEVTSLAPNLFSGSWSPWFGQGYQDFHWTGFNPPQPLDDVIGAAVVNQDNGLGPGFRLAVNIHPRWQVEFAYAIILRGLRFEDAAWADVSSVIPASTALLRSFGAIVRSKDESVRASGETAVMGLSVHYNILDAGPVIPYVFAGFRYVDNGEEKLISYYLNQQERVSMTQARYFLDVYYQDKSSVYPSFGAGAKVFFGETLGLKLDVTAVSAPLILEQRLIATYDEDYWWWTDFDNCDMVAATQRTNRFMVIAGIGLFATF